MAQTYASFWQRLGASFADLLVLWPIGYLAYEGDSKILVWLTSLVATIVTTGYPILLHARFGQTVGKRLTGIRVVGTDGTRIGWRQSSLRSVVDIILALVFTAHYGVRLATMPDAAFYGVDALTRERHLVNDDLYLHWLAPAVLIWTFSEVVVMLFNERRRSVHDFIAGTVVVEAERRASVEANA